LRDERELRKDPRGSSRERRREPGANPARLVAGQEYRERIMTQSKITLATGVFCVPAGARTHRFAIELIGVAAMQFKPATCLRVSQDVEHSA
jgi:hypothetical protein